MNRGEDVVFRDALGDEDRVLEVVALPRHERDEHVLPESELAHVGARTVGEHFARLHPLARADDRLLVVASRLVRPLELGQRVDVGDFRLVAFGANDDAGRVDALDDAVSPRERADAGVAGELALHARADERRVAADERHGLTLHVRAHERAVRVVVLEERHERRRDRTIWFGATSMSWIMSGVTMWKSPFRRALTSDSRNFPFSSMFAEAWAMYLPSSSSAEYHDDIVRHSALGDPAVRSLDEAVLVDARERRERRDEADVRTFRRLDRADTAVVRRVNVADFEACALAGETARPEGRETTLVSDLTERVRLVHELRELRAAEVLLHHRGDGLRVDEIVRHQRVDLLRHAHALFDRTLHAHQPDAILIFHQLADGAHTTVAEVVDVIDRAATVLQLDEVTHGLQDVLGGEHLGIERGALILGEVAVELVVQLEAADLREVVALRVEEQVVEERLRGLERGGIARAEPAVNFHDRVFGRLDLLGEQRVAEVGADVETVDEQDLERLDARFAKLLELVARHFLVDLEDDLAGLLVDDVVRRDLADELLGIDRHAIDLGFLELLDRRLGELGVLLDDDFLPIFTSRVARWPARRSYSTERAYFPPFSRNTVSVL